MGKEKTGRSTLESWNQRGTQADCGAEEHAQSREEWEREGMVVELESVYQWKVV